MWDSFGYDRVFVGRVTARLGLSEARPDGSSTSSRTLQKSEMDRISAHKYPNIPETTPYDPKFCADSEFGVRFDASPRNRELETQIDQTSLAHQVGIPTRSDRTEPKFGLTIKI